jgi:HTH-type transcriptional regulator / antitoxin HigA
MITYELAHRFAPGEFINEELRARGWSQRDLSDIMGVPPSVVSGLVTGTRSVTLDLARNLAAAFGNSAQHWINLEVAYRLSKTPEKHTAPSARSEIFNIAPVNERITWVWIQSADDVGVLRASVLNFFGISRLEDLEKAKQCYEARQSGKYGKANPAQRAWVRRVSLLARSLQMEKYSPSRISELLHRLQQLLRMLPRRMQVNHFSLLILTT